MPRQNLFDVDADGLKKLVSQRGLGFIFDELYQNVRDTNATLATMSLRHTGEGRQYRITVEDDDLHGFKDLSHAYTLFAESEKKSDPSKSGMFNLGEKLVIAVCKQATILTTTGGVHFPESGPRKILRSTRAIGSSFEGIVTMTQDEVNAVCDHVQTFIPRDGLRLTFNGEVVEPRTPVLEFDMKLPTPIADEEGVVTMRERMTKVSIYEPRSGETPMLYEHGIAVVENGSNWHYLVHQKTPVPFNRDNVPPSYLKRLHVECVNRMRDRLTPEDVTKPFVQVAVNDPKAEPATVQIYKDQKYGKKAVIFDPSDPEANNIAVSEGYTLIYGRSEPAGVQEHLRVNGIAKPAGQVTPSPKPYSEDGAPLKILDDKKVTDGMRLVAQYAEVLYKRILNPSGLLCIRFANDIHWPFAATYRSGCLIFNVGRLGYAWFDRPVAETHNIIDLIVHEYGHHYCSNHLDREYYDALTMIAGKLAVLTLTEPKLFRKFRAKRDKEVASV